MMYHVCICAWSFQLEDRPYYASFQLEDRPYDVCIWPWSCALCICVLTDEYTLLLKFWNFIILLFGALSYFYGVLSLSGWCGAQVTRAGHLRGDGWCFPPDCLRVTGAEDTYRRMGAGAFQPNPTLPRPVATPKCNAAASSTTKQPHILKPN